MTVNEQPARSLKGTGQPQRAAVRMGTDALISQSKDMKRKVWVFMEKAGREEGFNEKPASKGVMMGTGKNPPWEVCRGSRVLRWRRGYSFNRNSLVTVRNGLKRDTGWK